jgi:hypothetical protein
MSRRSAFIIGAGCYQSPRSRSVACAITARPRSAACSSSSRPSASAYLGRDQPAAPAGGWHALRGCARDCATQAAGCACQTQGPAPYRVDLEGIGGRMRGAEGERFLPVDRFSARALSPKAPGQFSTSEIRQTAENRIRIIAMRALAVARIAPLWPEQGEIRCAIRPRRERER